MGIHDTITIINVIDIFNTAPSPDFLCISCVRMGAQEHLT